MADVNVGDIVGRLRIDSTEWQRGLQQAQQQLAQFSQSLQSALPGAARQGQQSLAALSQSAAQLSQQLQTASQAAAQMGQQVQQAAQTAAAGMRQAQAAAQSFGSAWQLALSVAGGIGIATTISGIISGLKDLVTASIQAAARLENLRAQFTALQGAGQGAATLQNIFQTAQRLGVEFGTLATSFRGFMAATQGTTIEGERAQRVFEQITTGMRGMGTSSEQVGRALLALQQMVSKGTVSQEELRQQLGEALPGAMGIAARAFGVTTQEMNKMIEKGMDAAQFVQVFANQVQLEFGGKAATATNTLTAAWTRFTNELEQFGGAVAGSGLVDTLRDLVDWSTKLLANLRATSELRDQATGGRVPPLPRDIQDVAPRDILQRQQDLLNLRELQTGYGLGALLNPEAHAASMARLEEERKALQKIQDQAVKNFQAQLAAENERPLTAAQLPGARTTEAMRKIQEDLQKTLREIDLTAAFVTPLERAEARLKAIEESFKRMQEEARRLGAGMRESLTPSAAKPSPFDDLIAEAAARYNIPYNIARSLVQQESGFDPNARSPKGAGGLLQLMPGTAREMGLKPGEEFDPAKNLDAGLKYLSQLLEQFKGDWQKALTAYNAGPKGGGIPQAAGENATFATQVLGRAGVTTPGTLLGNLAAQRRAAEAAVEAEKPDTESAARIRATGREDIRAFEERERLRQQAARQAEQDQEHYQAAIDATRMRLAQQQDTAVATLTRLQEAYTHTAEGQDRLTAAKLAAQFPENEQIQNLAATVTALSEEAEATQESFNAIKQRTDALREASEAQDAFQAKLDAATARLLAPKEEREEVRLRQEARTKGITLTPEQEAQLTGLTRIREEQERLNVVVGIWRDLSQGIGSAWVQALSSIAAGTQTVAEAFRAMGQSILKTMADIAAQQAEMALFKLGAGLLTSFLTPTAPGGNYGGVSQGFSTAALPYGYGEFQHGGVVRGPTLAMLGEGPSHTLPETVLNRQQMAAVMSGGGNGQGQGVSIHNYPSKAEAEAGAASDRAQGHLAVVNAVLTDLSNGSGSKIGRAMRLLQQ